MRNRATTPLSKAKIRQSWSKYNLYNLQRFRVPPTVTRTFFQQKWAAKSVARAYHGEQIRESQWARMFSRRIRSVVPMNPTELARDDGSQMSSGRGAGLDKPRSRGQLVPRTPYAQMTFSPLERRLDVAIFRALFASSTRQARQFVVHGAVTVNGNKIRYPGYLLNPGDLFQVDPERVMYATGAPKDRLERREGRIARKKAADDKKAETGAADESASAKEQVEEQTTETRHENEDSRETLKGLLSQAKKILSTDKDVLPAKRKQELRGFQKAVRRVLSRSESSTVLTDNLEAQFAELTLLLKAKGSEKAEAKQTQTPSSTTATAQSRSSSAVEETQPGEKLSAAFAKIAQDSEADLDAETASDLSDEDLNVLKLALVQMRDNPIDHSKPYATPWRPRDYMSAFAFIPRYLEVNQNICAAVYLRHPVARPGAAEVPTPFPEGVSTAAFTWYLRRR